MFYTDILYVKQGCVIPRAEPQPIFKWHLRQNWSRRNRNIMFALRPQKRSCLLGTGGGAADETVKARPWIPPWKRKDRRDRGPPPEQCRDVRSGLRRRCPCLAIAQRLVHCRAAAVSIAVLGRVTRTMSVALLLRNSPKRKKSNFRSPAPPPCSWSLLG